MQRALIITLIVGFCQLSGIQSKIRTATTNHTIPATHFFMEYDQIQSSSQVYGTCLKNFTETHASCRLYLETTRPIDLPDHVLTCDFNVTFPWDPEHEMTPVDDAAAIAEDKAVLLFSHDRFHKLYVVHFSDCTVVPVEFSNDTSIRHYTDVLYAQSPHDDRFDVLLDRRGRLRRLTVNDRGQIVADVPEWFLYSDEFQQPFLYSPTKGRLTAAVDWNKRNGNTSVPIVAVDDSGSNHTIREHQFTDASGNIASAINELLTICVITDGSKTLSCVQYDENGDLKFETQLPHGPEAKIYNLAGGGFHLLKDLCLEKNLSGSCPTEKRQLDVTRVDRMGKVAGSLRIPTFNFLHDSHVHFFEAKNGEQCFAAIRPESEWEDETHRRYFKWERLTSFRHDVTCFSNTDYVTSSSSPIE